MNIHLVRNSLNANFSKSQKSHYERIWCTIFRATAINFRKTRPPPMRQTPLLLPHSVPYNLDKPTDLLVLPMMAALILISSKISCSPDQTTNSKIPNPNLTKKFWPIQISFTSLVCLFTIRFLRQIFCQISGFVVWELVVGSGEQGS